MGLMLRVLRRLIPIGIGAKFRALVDAIALYLQTVYEEIKAIMTETNPGTAVDTLADWYATIGLKYDATLDLGTRQSIAKQAYISIGGQSISALNDAIQIAFPDVIIQPPTFPVDNSVGVGMVGLIEVQDYPSWYTGTTDDTYPITYYRVTGEINDQAEQTALLNLLDRIAPAEMEPETSSLVIRNQTETAEVGLAMVGLAQVGRTKEDA